MNNPSLIDDLIDALRILPGVGPRSAQRMAYHLLLNDSERGLHLATTLTKAIHDVKHCEVCNTLTTHEICTLCQDTRRNTTQLCIVEMPTDILAIEQARVYQGRYFVLMGHLSPLDGIGPEQLHIDKLMAFFPGDIKEVIFAINPTVEGDATIHYLNAKLSQYDITLSQLASGVPVGGELEYLNTNTIGQALLKRSLLEKMDT